MKEEIGVKPNLLLAYDRSSDVPSISEGMFGFEVNRAIYFADSDGSNIRTFVP